MADLLEKQYAALAACRDAYLRREYEFAQQLAARSILDEAWDSAMNRVTTWIENEQNATGEDVTTEALMQFALDVEPVDLPDEEKASYQSLEFEKSILGALAANHLRDHSRVIEHLVWALYSLSLAEKQLDVAERYVRAACALEPEDFRFVQLSMAVGGRYENAREFTKARDWYQRGLSKADGPAREALEIGLARLAEK